MSSIDNGRSLSGSEVERFSESFVAALPRLYPNAHVLISSLCSDAQRAFNVRLDLVPDFPQGLEVGAFHEKKEEIARCILTCLSTRVTLGRIPLIGLDRDAGWDDFTLSFSPESVFDEVCRLYVRIRITVEGSEGHVIHPGSVWNEKEDD